MEELNLTSDGALNELMKMVRGYYIDTISNENYFLIYKDGILYLRINKKSNDINTLKRYFNIKD